MTQGNEDLYAQDGVNVSLGDKFSAFAGGLCAATYGNCPNLEVVDYSQGLYRGPRFFITKNLPIGTGFHIAPDGIGTKVVITDAAGTYEESAADWAAMCCGDITRYGGKPAILCNDFNVSSLGEGEQSFEFMAACRLMRGLQEVANRQGLVMYNGETAEVGPLVASPNPEAILKYLWSGVAFGFFHPKNIITGSGVRVGQRIVAFRERGLRSNAGSSARAAFQMQFGDGWYRNPEAKRYVRMAAEPSVIYDQFLAYLNGWRDKNLNPLIRAALVVHLTGGSFHGKFFDDFLRKHGFSAVLSDLFDPPEIMQRVAEWRGYDSAGFYDTFHGGQGVIMAVEREQVDSLIQLGSDNGFEIRDVGEITSQDAKPALIIHSKYRPGEIVTIE